MRKESLTARNINRIDKSGLLELLLNFSEQCKAAYNIGSKVSIEKINRNFTKIVFAGVGGSAIGGDLVRAYSYFKTKLPILIVREYELPAYVDSSSLVFVSSYSGNTGEILSAYSQAKDKGALLICISSGGLLKEYAQRDKIIHVEIPKGFPPRCALGFLSIIPLCILSRLKLIDDIGSYINELCAVLDDLRNNSLRPGIPMKDNIAKCLAYRLFNKPAVIYAPSIHFDMVALRIKGELAENSESFSSINTFPEMCHNEIMGWNNPQKLIRNFVVLMLKDKQTDPRVSRAMEVTRDIIKKQQVEVIDIWSRGESLLSRMFSLIYIGEFISFYLAILYGCDPAAIDNIEYLKKRMNQLKNHNTE